MPIRRLVILVCYKSIRGQDLPLCRGHYFDVSLVTVFRSWKVFSLVNKLRIPRHPFKVKLIWVHPNGPETTWPYLMTETQYTSRRCPFRSKTPDLFPKDPYVRNIGSGRWGSFGHHRKVLKISEYNFNTKNMCKVSHFVECTVLVFNHPFLHMRWVSLRYRSRLLRLSWHLFIMLDIVDH